MEGKSDQKFNKNACNFYVHAPARTDPTVCPEGHDAITILVPVSPLEKNEVYSEAAEQDLFSNVKTTVLSRLQSIPNMPSNLENYIVGEIYRTPFKWKEDFELYRGSAFGLAHTLTQLSFLRPRIKHPHLPNIYRVGASTRPGNGVPLVMIGGRLTAEQVLRDLSSS